MAFRNGTRPVLYDLRQRRPDDLVERDDRLEVAERLSSLGEIVEPLTDAEIGRVVDEAVRRNLRAGRRVVPVQLPARRARAAGRRGRASGAARRSRDGVIGDRSNSANTRARRPRSSMRGCGPSSGGTWYERLRGAGDGRGCAVPRDAIERGLRAGGSGRTGSASLGALRPDGRRHRRDRGWRNGTGWIGSSPSIWGASLDVCLVHGGVPPTSATRIVDDHPVLVPSVDMVTVGAGGGASRASIAPAVSA